MYKLCEYYSLEELETQYRRQSKWSAQVLEYFWPHKTPKRILDVGCGPAPDYFLRMPSVYRVGADIDFNALGNINPEIPRVQADCISLPFKDEVFDVVLCHYLLLWAPIEETLREMWRVTALEGRLICASEPDYTGRQEVPSGIKEDLVFALESLGANPSAGAELDKKLAVLTSRFITGILTPIEDKEFQLNELRNDIEFLSRVLKKDMLQKARPLMDALEHHKGSVYMPVHYGCAFK